MSVSIGKAVKAMPKKNPTLDFALFLETWNMIQGFTTPKVHCRIVDWLQEMWEAGETRLLLMAFRSCGKSTLVGLFCAWLLWRDPNLRIMVLAAENNLATKMVRNIKKIIELHPFTKELKPSNPDQWASDRFTIDRDIEMRDPSVIAAGITGNITGSRADLVIYDDVEVPNTCDSVDKREGLRNRLSESNFILSAGGRQLYVGTPHTYFSIYADQPRMEIGEKQSYLHEYRRLKIPILDGRGNSAWEERYSLDDIKRIRMQAGPNRFSSQMMLEPKNVLKSRLNTALLEFYDEVLTAHEAGGELQLKLGQTKLVSCSAWWDPAFGAAKGDSSVLAVVFSDNEGRHYVQHVEYIKIDPKAKEDEATAQCRIVARLAHELFIPSITVETNGIGQYLPGILKRELSRARVPCSVLEKHNSKNKDDRILESYDAVMAARALYIHDSVRQTPYLTEMSEWQPKRTKNKDDGLDAVAGALSLEPMRIKYARYTIPKLQWSGGSKTHQASSDFDV